MQRRESELSLAAGSELTIAAVPRRKLAGAGSVRPHAGAHYDRYELIHPIGEGGMGTVWLARMRGEHGFERVVALKVLLPSFVRDLRYRNMFIDEARIASRVVHANVAQVIHLGEKDGNLYLVMEWVNGDSLGSLLHAAVAQNRTVPLTVLLRIFADVCAGLHAAHELRDQRGQPLNVVHRDVSPQNILVTDAGTVKVIDFGVVKARGRIAEDTTPGVVKGKLQYMAPERAIGADVDRRADIWTVGAIMYRILAGRATCDAAGNPALTWALVLRDQLAPLPSSVPPAIVRVVMRAIARNPKDRHRSAAELQGELERVLHGISVSSATTSGDVAAFVTAVLGSGLAERRAAIERALGGEDQTATLHFLRPHIALVPALGQPAPGAPPAALPRQGLPPIASLPAARSASAPAPARLRHGARHLPALCAAGGLALLALVIGNHLRPSADANHGRAAASLHSSASGYLQPVRDPGAPSKRELPPEPAAVNVDDLALASPPSNVVLGSKRARPRSLAEHPPALAKLASDSSTTKAPADASGVVSLKCNPPYAFDRNGRKKFRPECF